MGTSGMYRLIEIVMQVGPENIAGWIVGVGGRPALHDLNRMFVGVQLGCRQGIDALALGGWARGTHRARNCGRRNRARGTENEASTCHRIQLHGPSPDNVHVYTMCNRTISREIY